MSSVVNKSKNKFAPKAKVRARNVTSATPVAADPSPSVSSTPAPATVPIVVKPVFEPTPVASSQINFLPTPVSQYSSYEHENGPYDDRNAGIPMLMGMSELSNFAPPPQFARAASIPAHAPTRPATTVPTEAELVTVEAVTPQGQDKASGEDTADTAVDGKERALKGEGKTKETSEQSAKNGVVTVRQGNATATVTVTKSRARKAPSIRVIKRKATAHSVTVLEAAPSTGNTRRSTRTKRQRIQETIPEDSIKGSEEEPVDDGDEKAASDEEEEDGEEEEYEEEQPKRIKPKPKTKPKVPRQPKVSKAPKEPGQRRTRRRAESPVDSEDRKIEESVVKMRDLCHDLRIGQKSKRGKELENTDWNEVVRRQRAYKADLAARRARGEIVDETTEQRLARLAEASGASRPMAAPQMRIVDGQIVLDEESLRVDRHQRDALEVSNMEVVEENVHTRLVNSGTWSKREKGDRWEDDATSRFYETLSMFGTDFEIISRLFPGRSRRQIKNKFNCEERKDPWRVTQALKNRIFADIGEYSEAAGQQFPDPGELKQELQRLRDEHEAEGELQKTQAIEMERERQEQANQAMRDAEKGIVHEQPGKKKKKAKGKDTLKSGEIVLSVSIEEYEKMRLKQLEEE